MVKVEISVTINRPVEEVFAFVTNPENGPRFDSGLLEVKEISAGPMGVGTHWKEMRKFLGRRIEQTAQVTEYEPNKLMAFKVASGPIAAEGSYLVEPANGGTRLTITGQGETSGFFKMADPLVGRMVKRQLAADSANLKDLLEAGA